MKHSFLSFTAILLCSLLLSVGFSGCGKTVATKKNNSAVSSVPSSSQVQQGSAVHKFSLPVVLTKDLNPLTTDCMLNAVLWPLMYDCLAQPDSGYNAVMGLATSVDVKGTAATAHLRSGVRFSDGSSLTVKDVVYSYEEVRSTPNSFFASNVSNISDVSADGSSTVVFTLKTPDCLFANLLNVPIIKANSDTKAQQEAQSSSTIVMPPTGSGIYTFSTDRFSGTLSYNKSWYKGTTPGFQTIPLVNILNSNATYSSLKINEINYLFSDYGGGAVPAVGLSSKSVNLNRLVYMGVNCSKSQLSNANLRKALSLAIDRKSIASDVYSSRALPAALPFNPSWSSAPKTADSELSSDYSKATNELSSAGLGSSSTSGSSGSSLNFSMLVNSSNTQMVNVAQKIAASFSKLGISVTVDSESSENYSAKLSQKNFDLYLGEIVLSDDMDLTPLLSSDGAAAFGVPQNSSTLAAFNKFREGSAQAQSVAEAFNSETPFIPICYKTGSVSYTKGLSGNIQPTNFNIFYGIEGWHY